MVRLIDWLKSLTGIKRQLAAFLSGAFMAFALAPFHLFFVCFISFPVLVWLVDGIVSCDYKRRKKYLSIALTGWSFGWGYFIFGLWWLSSAFFVDIASYYWAIPFAVLGLPAFLALYYALATLIAACINCHSYGRIVALSLAFGLSEWLRGIAFTGFPWNSIGYTAMFEPVSMQIAFLIGVFGVNFLAVLVYATPAVLADKQKLKMPFIIAALIVLFDIGFGLYRLSFAPHDPTNKDDIYVRLVQPVFDQSQKMNVDMARKNYEELVALSIAQNVEGARKPDLIIWPETALPYYLDDGSGIKTDLASILQDTQLLLMGTVRRGIDKNGAQLFYNAVEVINKNAEIIAFADKMHLVPFGEYMPLGDYLKKIGLTAIAEIVGGYSAAKNHKTIALFDQLTILPLICYEAIFPNEMTYDGPKPNVLINVSNDAWFGQTPGPWQHFEQARLRAVEQNMPLIRVTNNAVTAIIDPYGRIIKQFEQNKVGFLDAFIPSYRAPNWCHIASNQGFLCIAIVLLLLLLSLFLRSYPYR